MRGGTMIGGRMLASCAVAALLAFAPGCTRHFFRHRADTQAEQVLREKDVVPNGKIEQFHVYPDSRARFADSTDPDRPPMPPDDPFARMLAPTPQKPGHAGVARVEGKGYLALMDSWDEHNRANRRPVTGDLSEESSLSELMHRKKPRTDIVPDQVPPRPLGPDGTPLPYKLTLDQAVELGIINSREFQNRREDLYLLALPVTFERFGFAAQFFAVESTIRERTGSEVAPGQGDRWRGTGAAGFTKLFSTGALLLVQYANQTVINLANARNPADVVSVSNLNLDIVQPLLQGGGKAVTLEPLTQAERNLLYEVRDYARFRKVYFQFISGGNDLVANILSPGATLGGISLTPGTTTLGSGNPARPTVLPSSPARQILATGLAATSSGFLPTLQKQATLDIERKNYDRLRSVFKLFAAYEEGGRVSSLQVGQVELNILQSQSSIYTKEQDYRDTLDTFKFQLGVPLDIPLELDSASVDPVFQQFSRYETTIEQFNNILKDMETVDTPEAAVGIRAKLRKLLTDAPFVKATVKFRTQFPQRWQKWQRDQMDDKTLADTLPKLRAERNQLLDEKLTQENAGVKVDAKLLERLKALEREVPLGEFELALRRMEAMTWLKEPTKRGQLEEFAARFRDVRSGFTVVLSEASNERLDLIRSQWPALPGITLDGLDLVKADTQVELEERYAAVTHTALENRFDLMNARGQMVDAWRQVAIRANALLGAVNVGYHLDSMTPPDLARPLDFSGSRTRHQLFLNFELPLVRVSERNAYRAALIGYQRARRSLMATEDAVVGQVRTDLRNLQVLARNYRVQQKAVELAYMQVESSLETFQSPPAPGQGGDNAAAAAALTQQLLNAYARLPNEQNRLVTIWLNYQIARQQLFLDLELMPLDFRGVWIDEFNSFPSHAVRLGQPVALP
jgi:hypothetical protein